MSGASLAGREDPDQWQPCQARAFRLPLRMSPISFSPSTVSGKPQKYLMRKQANAELGLDQAETVETA